jgi:hypothetical protein
MSRFRLLYVTEALLDVTHFTHSVEASSEYNEHVVIRGVLNI